MWPADESAENKRSCHGNEGESMNRLRMKRLRIRRIIATVLLMSCLLALPLGAQSTAPVITLPLKPEGFGARLIKVKSGTYLLHLLNRSSVTGLLVYVDRMPADSLTDESVEKTARGAEDIRGAQFVALVKLRAGLYRVSVLGHPRWVCGIVVE
jgi:hypothetical protein